MAELVALRVEKQVDTKWSGWIKQKAEFTLGPVMKNMAMDNVEYEGTEVRRGFWMRMEGRITPHWLMPQTGMHLEIQEGHSVHSARFKSRERGRKS